MEEGFIRAHIRSLSWSLHVTFWSLGIVGFPAMIGCPETNHIEETQFSGTSEIWTLNMFKSAAQNFICKRN